MTKVLSDPELLKLAARAAGIDWFDEPALQAGKGLHMKSGPFWNPLTDDGDALRLAVKLRIDLEWREDGRISAYRHAHADGHCFTAIEFTAIESGREDSAAATRRAIVRAAAAIAQTLPSPPQ